MSTPAQTTALAVYEKYTVLNQELENTRKKRIECQKHVEEIRERLEQYETREGPALTKATQSVKDETIEWQSKFEQTQKELEELQMKHNLLAKSRDKWIKDNSSQQENRHLVCRDFVIESRAFQERQCPQLHLALSLLPVQSSSNYPAQRLTRLHAIGFANGWDTTPLPDETSSAKMQSMSDYASLTCPARGDQVQDWAFWDTVFTEDDNDDKDMKLKLAEYRKLRQNLVLIQQGFAKAEHNLEQHTETQLHQSQRRKQQLALQFERISKEIQQLEISISTTLAAREMEQGETLDTMNAAAPTAEFNPPTNKSPEDTVSVAPGQSLERVERMTNPYRRGRQSSQRPAEPPLSPQREGTPSSGQPEVSYRPRHSNARKRKLAFGSSLEIGGEEMTCESRQEHGNHAPSSSSFASQILRGLESEEEEEDEAALLSFTPFQRKKTS